MMSVLAGVLSSVIAHGIAGFLGTLLKAGNRYIDLEIPPTDAQLDRYHVSIPPYGDFTISGETHELTENMELGVDLPDRTARILVAAWGVRTVPGGFRGALTDSGKIAELYFRDVRKTLSEPIEIALPFGADEAALKLADADPLISGYPPAELVAQMGILSRISVPHKPNSIWFQDRDNVWVSEVDVPRGSSQVLFKTAGGSMNIVHIRAVRRFRLFDAGGRLKAASPKRRSVDREVWNEYREAGLSRALSHERVAEGAVTAGNYSEAVSSYAAAADEFIMVAYLPGDHSDRLRCLASAAGSFLRAAEGATTAADIVLGAKYYVRWFLAMGQAGHPRDEVVVGKAIDALERLDAEYRTPAKFDLDMLIKAWTNAGRICIDCARDPTFADKRVHYYERAWDYYLNKIVKTVIGRPLPSFADLRMAEQRLNILKRWYLELRISKPDLLASVDDQLKRVRTALDERYPPE